ncbi:CHAT domain-containing protein [Kamptonema formosum]|uniref:CHAT domain-containing protein n=1 Tax=Kamptonema formosum TaxID=331992 RepID=UPI00034C3C12|nr:tetratricopeptide repeat protein [Oscillatoria sp. PCC 10802]
MEVEGMGKKLKQKTSQDKLVLAFLQGVSLSGVIMGALLSESGLATPNPSETGFVQKAGSLGESRFCRDALAIEIAAIQTKPACAGFHEPVSPLTSWKEADKISLAGTLSAGIEKWDATGSFSHQSSIIAQTSSSPEADRLLQEGVQLFKQGTAESLRAALEKWEAARQLYRAAGDKGNEAVTLVGMGSINDDLGEKRKALEFYNQALPLLRAVGDRGGEATTLTNIGLVYSSLGEKQKALEFYNQALPLVRAVGDRGGEAATLNNIGLVYNSLGEKQKALEFLNQALPLRRAVGDRQGEATTLNNIGGVYSSLGEKQKALEFFNQALPLKRAVGDRGGEATTLNNIGFVYNSLGEKQKALEFYNQALPLTRAVGDRGGEATTLNNIGGVYESLGEKQKALEFYNQALPLLRAVGDRGGEAATLNNIGFVYNSLGEKQKALEFYNQALPLLRAVGDRRGEAMTLNNIGGVYSSLGEKQKALKFLNQALPLTRAVGDRGGEAGTLNNIGRMYDSLGEKQKALEFYNQALPLFRAVGDRQGEATTLSNFAYLRRNQGNLTEALTDIEAAIAIIEDLRTKIGSQELRQSYFATVQNYYQFYIDLLMQLHQQNPSQGYDAKALHASERSRARSLLELLTEAGANIRQGVDPQLLQQEQNLQQRLNAVENQRYQLTKGQYTQEQVDELKAQSDSLLNQFKELQAKIRVTSPRYANLKYPDPLNLEQIQQQVLDEDTLLLEYSLGEDRSYLWAVTKNSIASYVLPKQSEIEAAAESFREAVTKDSKASVESGLPLSQMLLTPVASQLGKKRLLIVGDGVLQYVPFAALPIPFSPTAPLVVQNEIVTLPSASTIAIQRQQLQNRSPVPKTVAVLADPVFDKDDPRLTKTPPQESPETLNNSALTRATRNLGLGQSGPEFSRLEYTRTEAQKILALVPESQRLQALDFNASLPQATDRNLSQYQIVHLATHGVLDPVNPELSGVVLSLLNEQGQPEDGFLRLHDIFNLNLPAELVVLSACKTGLGKQVRGEGLVGLTRGFMYAGARRVVVSLWSVNDVATSEVMAKFYQKMLNQGKNPIQALREAQLEMFHSGQWQSPYYWAAFTVQGDWR